MTILYWYWLILGAILIIAEIAIPSFTIFWLGLAALIVGGLVFVFPNVTLSVQLLVWAIGSVLLTMVWFLVFKPRMLDRTTAGISREAVVGETGHVIRVPVEGQRGMVRFNVPVLGADEWAFICETSVGMGDRVTVRDVSGNTLIVDTAATVAGDASANA